MTTSPIRQDKTETNAQSSSASLNKRPIWEIVAEIGAQIPDEDWATVPNDASINYRKVTVKPRAFTSGI